MFKKSLAIALLVASIPAVASASWFLSTQARNAGGTIDTRNLTGQSVTDGALFKSYTTSAGIPVTVTAADGFTIRNVSINGVTVATSGTTYTDLIAGGQSDKSVTASFAATTFGVSASFPNGMVSPAAVNNLYKGYQLKSDLTFTFSPMYGYAIGTVTGFTAGPNVVLNVDSVKNRATLTFKAGYVFDAPLSLSATATATAAANGFDAIAPKNVITGSTVTLSASGTGLGSALTWAYVSGPQNTVTFGSYTTLDQYGRKNTKVGTTSKPGPAIPLTVSGNTVSFAAPSVPGQYKFTVTDGTYVKMATVNVSASYADMSNLCQNCHSANGIGDPKISSDWSSSDHANNGIVCAKCHVGADTGGHPGSTYGTAALKNVCLNCHNSTVMPDDPQGPNYLKSAHYQNPYGEGVVYCSSCHNQHQPAMSVYSTNHQLSFYTGSVPTAVCTKCHTRSAGRPYGLYSSNGVGMAPHFDPTNSGAPAFMNNRTCTDCHGHNNSINGQWAQSGHGDVTSSAWAEGGAGSPCVRCHTTTGFINYSTFKVVTPLTTPIKKEVLGCNGCHTSPDMTYSPFGNLTTVNGVTGSLRKIAPYPATYTQNGSAAVSFQFPDDGPSNVCIPCHSGRVSGKNIQGLTSNMSNIGFVNSHYKAAAGIMYRSIGYEYYDSSMYSDPADTNSVYYEHTLIGTNTVTADGVEAGGTGSVGPCAGCHMYAPDGNGPGHTLHIFNKDATGAVTGLNNSICIGCHTNGGDPGALDFTDSSLTNVNAQVTGFQASLGALQALLQSKGIYYNSASYPYFYTSSAYTTQLKDWTLGTLDNAQGKNNMGAAFNLNLLTREEGAFAHNRYYTKRLIFDAIDWLQNGSMTGSINVGAIPDGAPDGHGGTTPVFDINAATSYLGGTRP